MEKVIVSGLAMALALPVFAQTTTAPLRPTPTRDIQRQVSQEMQQFREEAAMRMREQREAMADGFGVQREQLHEREREHAEEFRNAFEQKREELKQQLQQERNTLRARLQSIKDQRKAQITQRVHDNLNALNGRLTEHFLNVLERLEKILMGIEERADAAGERGVDMAATRAAITAARDVIAQGRAAVEAQAGLTYVVEVSTEDALRHAATAARRALHDDLKELRDVVFGARDAVRKAAVAFAEAMSRHNQSGDGTATTTDDGAATSTNSTAGQ